ncbi:MAG TPA: hypothetical protein VIT45_12070 [Allosphingosinicella sp.]
MKTLLKKLDNPFILAAEGFIAGAILFVAVNADSLEARINPPASQAQASAQR